MLTRDDDVVAALVHDPALSLNSRTSCRLLRPWPASRWRTSACTPRPVLIWSRSAHPERASSMRPTPSGAGSSGTCTTALNNEC